MADCEKIGVCPMIRDQLERRPGIAHLFIKNYCKKNNTMCARFVVEKKLGANKVPPLLFPNQMQYARELLARELPECL